jgi:hypothetical protein
MSGMPLLVQGLPRVVAVNCVLLTTLNNPHSSTAVGFFVLFFFFSFLKMQFDVLYFKAGI